MKSLLIFPILSLLIVGCQSPSEIENRDFEKLDRLTLILKKQSSVIGINSGELLITHSDIDTIKHELLITDSTLQATVTNLPIDLNLKFEINLYDSSQVLIYSGHSYASLSSTRPNYINIILFPVEQYGTATITATFFDAELDQKVIFYTLSGISYMMNLDGTDLQRLNAEIYPIWLDNKQSILSTDGSVVYVNSIVDNFNSPRFLFDLEYGGIFPWYSKSGGFFLVVYRNNYGLWSIGQYDLNNFNLKILLTSNTKEYKNPKTSAVDDIIYFITEYNGAYAIFSMNPDFQSEELLVADSAYNYYNINISYDGSKVIATKKKLDESDQQWAIIDTKSGIEENIYFPHDFSVASYTSFTSDMKYVLFNAKLSGSSNYNIYRYNLKTKEINQLTYFTEESAYAPLQW